MEAEDAFMLKGYEDALANFASPIDDQYLISVRDTPESIFKYPILTKLNKHGKEIAWEVGFDGENICMTHGQLDGKIRTDYSKVIPKSNRTLMKQALQEARQARHLKLGKGYTEPCNQDEREILPMKGQEYEQKHIKFWPVYTQIKFDGVRLLVYKNQSKLLFKSSLNNDVKTLDHLLEELTLFSSLLPPICVLDGEVYNHERTFQEIISGFKKKNDITPTLEYWIFDVDYRDQLEVPHYQERYALLVHAFDAFEELLGHEPQHVRVVNCDIANSHEEIDFNLDMALTDGYEGLMIKKIYMDGMKSQESKQCLYNHGRTFGVLKYKKFIDEEATIIGGKEAEGNQSGCVIFHLRDMRDKEFMAVPKWSLKRKRDAFVNLEWYIGKVVTFKYQNLTDDGVPRHPSVKELRDYE
jgi:ATP-dependent DNA ligase